MINTAFTTPSGSRVRILPESVANQIAAGEVVERPASVIKELVENSLDAGAGSLYIGLRNGGKSLIEVSDDGHGMGRDDALTALERHATSKISLAGDLKSIMTLGFRGEALPSIASVTRLTLSTCLAGAEAGVEITAEGGRLRDVKDSPPIPGARVEARDLFFNTPARRKFLRSEEVEAGHCQEAVIRQALPRPDAAFRLARDGKIVIDAPACAGPRTMAERISAIFGPKTIEELCEVNHERGGMRLHGFISKPGRSRPARSMQYIYVNGRYLRDRIIGHAVMEGYRSLLPRGRYPAVFLFLSMPADRVDVNVHPAKTEARFADGRSVAGLVREGVYNALRAVKDAGTDVFTTAAPAPSFAQRSGVPEPAGLEEIHTEPPRPLARGAFSEPVAQFDISPEVENLFEESAPEGRPGLLCHHDRPPSPGSRVIGQVFGSFLLVEEDDRLLFLDQHTAHERILYESLVSKYGEGRVDAQELLFPVEIELSARGAALLKERLAELERLGLVLEEFGDRFFMLRFVPAILAGADPRSMIVGIADRIAALEGDIGLDHLAQEVISVMACRGAVKAGQRLGPAQIEALAGKLGSLDLPYTCPHGRPVALAMKKDELLRGFLRK